MIVRRPISTALWATLASAVALGIAPSQARADEPYSPKEPRLLSESAEVTSVVDAFDDDDPFDFHVFAAFEQRWKSAKIRRETSLAQPGLSTGGFVPATENVASYSQSLSIVNLGVDVGIFKDFGLVFRAPIIVADQREMGDLAGSSRNPQRLMDTTGDPIFTVPFKSPTRAGIDYMSLGLRLAPLNQQRDRSKPTWMLGLDWRFGVGSSLHACDATPGRAAPACPDHANPGINRDPGISRGMWGLEAHTMISRRFGYVEPYTGFAFLAEFPQERGDYGTTNNLRGSLLNHPPLVGSLTIGMEVIPWEHRENFQRLVGDFRIQGIYHSEGREYSELFDALGSTNARTLTSANPATYTDGPNNSSVADPASTRVYFTGITDQKAYGSFKGQAGLTWQAGEFLKLSSGLSLEYAQSHMITGADPCNPNVDKTLGTSGPCRSVGTTQVVTGVPNPNHRDTIDIPGHRFSVDDSLIIGFWINGTLMF
jgi:hypothetical protein